MVTPWTEALPTPSMVNGVPEDEEILQEFLPEPRSSTKDLSCTVSSYTPGMTMIRYGLFADGVMAESASEIVV